MKIYTKTGDDGSTGVFGGPRLSKDAPRIEAYGTVDELNAVLGMARASQPPPLLDPVLERLQNELFDLGAELATPQPEKMRVPQIGDDHIARLEGDIDRHEECLAPLERFILPGGTRLAAELHLARTVCRRAERRVVSLAAMETVSTRVLVYLNRLSDLLFVLARWSNRHAGQPDVPWQKR